MAENCQSLMVSTFICTLIQRARASRSFGLESLDLFCTAFQFHGASCCAQISEMVGDCLFNRSFLAIGFKSELNFPGPSTSGECCGYNDDCMGYLPQLIHECLTALLGYRVIHKFTRREDVYHKASLL